jgi:flagellar operon protein
VSIALNPALLPDGLLPAGGLPSAGPARATGGSAPGGRAASTASTSGPSFAEALQQAGKTSASEPLHFSKHALERVQRRGISLDPTTLGRLHEGVGRAAGKGSRDSIVLVDGTAFVVSVNNRTVVTAVGSEHMREHVFTNIDSAVIA